MYGIGTRIVVSRATPLNHKDRGGWRARLLG